MCFNRDLERAPAADQVHREHLPQRAAVGLRDPWIACASTGDRASSGAGTGLEVGARVAVHSA